MRKLLVTLGVLVVTAGAVLVVALVALNRLVDANRDVILQRVQAAIGRPVRTEQITVSVWSGLGVQLRGVSIAEDPRFGPGDFLTAAALTARADLLPLLRGRLRVSRVALIDPVCQVIRNAAGDWNYASLQASATTDGPHHAAGAREPGALAGSLAATIGRAHVQNGTLTFHDHSRADALTTHTTQIDFTLTDISATSAMRFALRAALDANAPNLHVSGSIGPVIDPAGIPITVEGTIGPVGPQQVVVEALHLAAILTPTAVRATAIDGRVFGGSVSLKGEFPRGEPGDAASAVSWLTGSVSGVEVAEVMRLVRRNAGIRLAGTGRLTLDLRSSGTTTAALERNLRGTVETSVRDGLIEDFSIVREVLGATLDLPGISTLISTTVRQKYGRLFSEKETRLETMDATFRIADQRAQTNDLTIVASDYAVHAAGWVDFDQQADFVGTLMMSERFSQDAVRDVKGSRHVLDQKGQLVVPFRLRGKLGTATPEPELGGLLHALTRGAANEVVGTLVGERPGSPGVAIEKGLRSLFGR